MTAATPTSDPARRDYLPELDGIRALCVLGVVACHLEDKNWWAWLSGHLGVGVFFVLSGYLITMLLLREERAGGVSFVAFYIRRSFRIFPLYYFALFAYAALIFGTGWGAKLRANFADSLPAYLFYYQEVPFAFEVLAKGRASPFAHSWSLGIEEKYYLLWPLLAFALLAGRRGLRLGIALGMTAVLLATQSAFRLGPAWEAWQLGVLLFPHGQILCGAALALALDDERGKEWLRMLSTHAGTIAAAALFAAAQLACHPWGARAPELVTLHTLAATALVCAVLLGDGPMTRALRFAPLTFIGRLSYGIYLFHGFGISAAQRLVRPGSGRLDLAILTFALAVGLTLVLVWVLALAVERPCIRLGRELARRFGGQSGQPALKPPLAKESDAP